MGGLKASRTETKGTVHFENEELSGIHIKYYHVKGDKFGVEVVLPEAVAKRIDIEKMQSGEHPKGYYTMGNMMEVIAVLTRHSVMHPDCVEVINFDGTKQDVSDIGVDKMMMEMLQGVAQEQYEKEVAAGIVPEGMTFEEWTEVSAPDMDAIENADKKRTLH